MASYINSPQYQAMMAQVLRGSQRGPQYPGEAIGNTLATILQAYTAKKFGEQQQAKEDAIGKTYAGAFNNEYDYGQTPASNTVMARLLSNPDVANQLGPSMASALVQQQARANEPITPYQRAQIERQNRTDSPEYQAQIRALPGPPPQPSVGMTPEAEAQALRLHQAPGPAPQPSVGMTPDAEAQAIRIANAKATAAGGGPPNPIKTDSGSASLNAQTGLSQFALNFLQGGTLPRGQAQQAQVNKEIQDWSIANGVDTATLRSQATGINHVVQQNIIRNNQGGILENELQGTIRTLAPIADAIGNGRINASNLVNLWGGKQVNDPDVQKYRDQLLRLRTELAGYNAVAGGKLTEQGTPRVDEKDLREAEQVILSGINSGGLKGLQNSVGATTAKNRNVLQNSIDDANQQMWGLFGVDKNYKRKGPPLNVENPGGGGAGAPDYSHLWGGNK